MEEEETQRRQTLTVLFHQAGEDHFTAHKQTNGDDPDWSIWYTDYLLEKGIETLLEAKLLRSDLIYLLVLVDKQQKSEAPGSQWEKYYTNFFARRYLQVE